MAFDIDLHTKAIDEAGAKGLFADYEDAIKAAEATDVDGVIDLECLCSGALVVHEGDLVVDELHLTAEGPSLLVEGNLVVHGTLVQEFRAGFVIVFGNVDAKNIATTAGIFVTGDMTVGDTLYGNCTNYSTDVLGITRARVLVSAKEHYFCLYGGHEIERIVDVYGDTPNLDCATDGEDALVDGIDSGFDEAAVAERLRRGHSLLLSDG